MHVRAQQNLQGENRIISEATKTLFNVTKTLRWQQCTSIEKLYNFVYNETLSLKMIIIIATLIILLETERREILKTVLCIIKSKAK